MPELTVVAWNVHWGRERCTREGSDPFDVVAPLLAYDADVCVLPEHFRDHTGVGITDPLREHGYEIIEAPFVELTFHPRSRVETPGEGWWGLVVATRLPIVDHELVPMARTFRDRAGLRHAIRVGVDVDGSRVDVLGLHTSSKLWFGAPAIQLRRLREHLESLRAGPAVAAGDFNFWGPPVEALLPGWRRTVQGRTWPADRPHSQIDHVLVNEHVRSRAGEVMPAAESDHLAIRARLEI